MDAAEAVRGGELHDAADEIRRIGGETGADALRSDCGEGGCHRRSPVRSREDSGRTGTGSAEDKRSESRGETGCGGWMGRAFRTSEGWKSSVSPSTAPPSTTQRLLRHCLHRASTDGYGLPPLLSPLVGQTKRLSPRAAGVSPLLSAIPLHPPPDWSVWRSSLDSDSSGHSPVRVRLSTARARGSARTQASRRIARLPAREPRDRFCPQQPVNEPSSCRGQLGGVVARFGEGHAPPGPRERRLFEGGVAAPADSLWSIGEKSLKIGGTDGGDHDEGEGGRT